MANKITLEFTQEQFRNLLDLIYAGNYLLTSTNEDGEEKYNEIESLVFSRTKDIGKEEYSEYVEEYGGYLPSKDFEEAGVQEKITGYDNVSFWNELVHRLALRDVAANLNTDNPDILIEAILDRSDEYEDFFDKHDLDTVRIKGMKPMNKNPNTFRSMDVGEIESYGSDSHDCDDENCSCHHSH